MLGGEQPLLRFSLVLRARLSSETTCTWLKGSFCWRRIHV